jgi:hypothetical protein
LRCGKEKAARRRLFNSSLIVDQGIISAARLFLIAVLRDFIIRSALNSACQRILCTDRSFAALPKSCRTSLSIEYPLPYVRILSGKLEGSN